MAQRMARLLLVSLVSIVACACVAVSFARPTHWRPDDYPNPSTNASACGRDQPQVAGAWLCDPDRLITPTAAAGLADLLRHVSAGAKPFAQAPCGASAIEGFPVRVCRSNPVLCPTPSCPAVLLPAFPRPRCLPPPPFNLSLTPSPHTHTHTHTSVGIRK